MTTIRKERNALMQKIQNLNSQYLKWGASNNESTSSEELQDLRMDLNVFLDLKSQIKENIKNIQDKL